MPSNRASSSFGSYPASFRDMRVTDRHGTRDRAAELAKHRIEICRIGNAAPLGEPLTLPAFERISAEIVTRRYGRRLQPDGPERLRQRHGARFISIDPLELDTLPPGAASYPTNSLVVQSHLQSVSHRCPGSSEDLSRSKVMLIVTPSDFSVRRRRVTYIVLRPASRPLR